MENNVEDGRIIREAKADDLDGLSELCKASCGEK